MRGFFSGRSVLVIFRPAVIIFIMNIKPFTPIDFRGQPLPLNAIEERVDSLDSIRDYIRELVDSVILRRRIFGGASLFFSLLFFICGWLFGQVWVITLFGFLSLSIGAVFLFCLDDKHIRGDASEAVLGYFCPDRSVNEFTLLSSREALLSVVSDEADLVFLREAMEHPVFPQFKVYVLHVMADRGMTCFELSLFRSAFGAAVRAHRAAEDVLRATSLLDLLVQKAKIELAK